MKILIAGLAKLKFMPYMRFYLNNIDVTENDVHILYWNRDLQLENTDYLEGIELHEFSCYQEDDVPKLSKIFTFRKYRAFALRLIKNEKFDFIFILHSLPGVLLRGCLTKYYSGRFILDYRDMTYETFSPFKKIVGKLVKYSCFTFVSSDAFRVFLPQSEKNKIITSHNLDIEALSHRGGDSLSRTGSKRIKIVTWGFIRYEKLNLELIKKVAADFRFELHYYGREQQIARNLKKYAIDHEIPNVFFHGEYSPNDRYELVRNTDIIHNIYYGNNAMHAISNKYYDGVVFQTPQLCIKGSFMSEIAEEHGVGLACDPHDSDFTEKVYQYYMAIDHKEFKEKCDLETERVCSEYYRGCAIIKETIKTVAERLP